MPLFEDENDPDVDGDTLPSDINITNDIYGAVVAASFGGLKQNLRMTETLLIHPFIPFVLTLPLFVIQANAIVCLHTDESEYKLTDPILNMTNRTGGQIFDMVTEDQLLSVKIVMVLVLQLCAFGKMMDATKMLIFLINPTTWTDIDRPMPSEMLTRIKFIFRAEFVICWPIMATGMKLTVLYMVCVDSVSIILASHGVQDAIFDSVAIMFLVELGEIWLQCVMDVFHLDPFDGFRITRMNASKQKELMATACIKVPESWILHSGRGARNFELFLTFFLMFMIYIRQLFLVVHAMDTNTIPLARDVCTLHRWNEGKSRSFRVLPLLLRKLLQWAILVDPKSHIEKTAQYCEDGKYDRLRLSENFALWGKHPKIVTTWILAIFLFLVMPQFIYAFNRRIIRWLYKDDEDFKTARKRGRRSYHGMGEDLDE